jgi:hypothetical protein
MTSIKGLLVAGIVAAAGPLGGCAGGPAPVQPEQGTLPPFGPGTGQPLPPTLRLIGVGDIMLGTNFPEEKHLNPDLVPGVDLATIIGHDLLDLLRGGDVTFGNMEGSLFDGPDDAEHKPCRNPKACYVFRSPEFHAGLLRDMGFNAMSLANNHAGDFREAGRAATMSALARNGIVFAGIDEPGLETGTLVLHSGVRVGLAAFAPNWGTISINDHGRAQAIVRGLDVGHDIVVVSFHGGAEGAEMTRVPREMEIFYGEQRGDVYRFAHDVIDAGADVVLGHGPHVPRAVEVYRDRFIAYSLGNFWTYGRFNLQDLAGIAPVVDLELSTADGRLLGARIHSIRQEGWGIPRIDPSGAALRAVADLTARDFPESALRFEDDGRIIVFPEPLIGWLAMARPRYRPSQ